MNGHMDGWVYQEVHRTLLGWVYQEVYRTLLGPTPHARMGTMTVLPNSMQTIINNGSGELGWDQLFSCVDSESLARYISHEWWMYDIIKKSSLFGSTDPLRARP